jgi:D-isomer specific 2-hydroxyacid dehydrogenase, NAD binding domain
VLTEDVADLALGLMLATSRRICVADRFVRTGGWLHEHWPPAAKMSGKRLGILGLGHVGRAVARRAEGFGMRIAYCDAAAPDAGAGRMFGGHQAEIGHQLPRIGEAAKVPDFGRDGHCDHQRDPPHRLQSARNRCAAPGSRGMLGKGPDCHNWQRRGAGNPRIEPEARRTVK